MGLLDWLFGSRAAAGPRATGTIEGPGNYAFDIVGEVNYQAALEAICGGRTEDGVNREAVAVLVCEDSNPHDSKAVRVDIDGMTVGYLSRTDARIYRTELRRQNSDGAVLRCAALIGGGWDRGRGDPGYFGVKLDLPVEETVPATKNAAPASVEDVKARHYTSAPETVKQLKREGKLEEAESLLLWCVEETEEEARREGLGVAPWYYEQLAIVYRKQGRTEDELAILERFGSQKHALGARPAKLIKRLENLRAKMDG